MGLGIGGRKQPYWRHILMAPKSSIHFPTFVVWWLEDQPWEKGVGPAPFTGKRERNPQNSCNTWHFCESAGLFISCFHKDRLLKRFLNTFFTIIMGSISISASATETWEPQNNSWSLSVCFYISAYYEECSWNAHISIYSGRHTPPLSGLLWFTSYPLTSQWLKAVPAANLSVYLSPPQDEQL